MYTRLHGIPALHGFVRGRTDKKRAEVILALRLNVFSGPSANSLDPCDEVVAECLVSTNLVTYRKSHNQKPIARKKLAQTKIIA